MSNPPKVPVQFMFNSALQTVRIITELPVDLFKDLVYTRKVVEKQRETSRNYRPGQRDPNRVLLPEIEWQEIYPAVLNIVPPPSSSATSI